MCALRLKVLRFAIPQDVNKTICGLVVLVLAGSAGVAAQKSPAAARQAGSWFNTGGDTFLRRTPALQKHDVDVWEVAARKAGIAADRADLAFTIPKFNPLFDAKDQVVAGAMAKYSKRFMRFRRRPFTNGRR
jgi:hypothetical protein